MDQPRPSQTFTTVLPADGEANLRPLGRATLAHPARRIVEAVDGDHALALARREPPDLLVLDSMMPGLSGLDVLRAPRNEPRTRPIPVAMLTPSSRDRDEPLAEQLGVDAYLVETVSSSRPPERTRAAHVPGRRRVP